MSEQPTQRPGQLCIWTDTDPRTEDDFNAWYDREHMQERVAIPGFSHARRFLASDGATRRYLALYETVSLEVFRSEAYRQAFAQQTEWSLRSFERMRDNQRRVGELAFAAGAGEGGRLALFVAAPAALAGAAWREAASAAAQATPGVHAVRVFATDASLSAPIATGAGAPGAALGDALVLVEGSSAAAAHALATRLAALADVEAANVRAFDLLWRLAA
ncbi:MULTISPECIES: DUF4286 family protein [Burkholderia]|jgi:hypothetical protein|uniref:Sugar ABC transporter n=1 Tax=Burkholderia gladioli TaxID=28095 RepID=A0AAW3EWW2_BURGA|nr:MULTISPECIES: DUF4286 family protein [Burkholderia]AJW94222.1 hypothetical protein BM43_5041 [Burkholderia gladioli]ASD82195.1 hypothetical protein CEJ98_24820 [Burkholderia gladioli pv. gladioli]AWY52445.1 hypothetical protein A8H28_15355 [Burkholderia gladioli pv. gladioli]AYQ91828.1 hypothetical protein EDD84_31670 [Burkholderia gladioli]KGC13064.1 hypothetical protein DM48_2725 [Burkholderia gladioli]